MVMEYLDVVDENDNVVGREERNAVHEKHLTHRALQVIIANSKNEVLLQFRKATKKQFPLVWDGSVAGHVSAGQTAEEAAYREMMEEIGIRTPLEFVGKFRFDNDVEDELESVFFGRSDGPFRFDETEMEKAEFFGAEEALEAARNKSMAMTPYCRRALELCLGRLRR